MSRLLLAPRLFFFRCGGGTSRRSPPTPPPSPPPLPPLLLGGRPLHWRLLSRKRPLLASLRGGGGET